MRCSPRFTVVVLASALVALPACENTSMAPDLSMNAFGHDGGAVTVPMEVDATMVWTVPGATAADCPDLIDPETGELFTAEGFGEGEATHLGRFEITELDHPTINMCSTLQDPPVPPDPSDLRRDGTFEFVAADGSAISGTYSFLFLPPEQGGFFTLSVEDGTKRFAGAFGALELVFEESGVTQPSDPLFLGSATLDPAVFEGEITVPRP
jgi:hypothetical protein